MSVSLAANAGIARTLEAADTMRLKPVRRPDTLHRSERNTGSFSHRPTGPVRRLMRRIGTGQRHHARDRLCSDRRLAGLARLVAQQAVDACFGETLLPAPDHRTADAELRGHALYRIARYRRQYDARTLSMLLRPIAIRRDRFQAGSIRWDHDHADCLCHATKVAHQSAIVNRVNGSEH